MQFSTIISVAAFIAAVAAAPVCEAPATQSSTVNCGNNPSYPHPSCVLTNTPGKSWTLLDPVMCTAQSVHIATTMCCSTQQQGLINVALPCINLV